MYKSCCQTTGVEGNLFLALALFMIEMTEAAVIPILAPALTMEAATAAKPCKVTKRTQRREILQAFRSHWRCQGRYQALCGR